MIVLITAGFVLTATMFVVMARINLLRFLGYSTWVDIVFTVIMFIMFAHTFSGVVAGSFAGLFMAAFLSMARKSLGYERYQRKGWGMGWVYHAPTWYIPGVTDMLQKAARG